MNHVLGGIHTVAGDLLNDIQRYRVGDLSHSVFMQKYGHLRPGTYDILSKRYDQMDSFSTPQKKPLRGISQCSLMRFRPNRRSKLIYFWRSLAFQK